MQGVCDLVHQQRQPPLDFLLHCAAIEIDAEPMYERLRALTMYRPQSAFVSVHARRCGRPGNVDSYRPLERAVTLPFTHSPPVLPDRGSKRQMRVLSNL